MEPLKGLRPKTLLISLLTKKSCAVGILVLKGKFVEGVWDVCVV